MRSITTKYVIELLAVVFVAGGLSFSALANAQEVVAKPVAQQKVTAPVVKQPVTTVVKSTSPKLQRVPEVSNSRAVQVIVYGRSIHARDLMTEAEHTEYRRAMKAARSLEEKQRIQDLVYARLSQRAWEPSAMSGRWADGMRWKRWMLYMNSGMHPMTGACPVRSAHMASRLPPRL